MQLWVPSRKTEINIVPLVDVLIVLIFFFLVSMQFRDTNALNIIVPEIETAGKNNISQAIEIAVNANNEVFFNGIRLNTDDLKRTLDLAADVSKEQTVLLIADEGSVLKSITGVMDACQEAGLEKIRLQAR